MKVTTLSALLALCSTLALAESTESVPIVNAEKFEYQVNFISFHFYIFYFTFKKVCGLTNFFDLIEL